MYTCISNKYDVIGTLICNFYMKFRCTFNIQSKCLTGKILFQYTCKLKSPPILFGQTFETVAGAIRNRQSLKDSFPFEIIRNNVSKRSIDS